MLNGEVEKKETEATQGLPTQASRGSACVSLCDEIHAELSGLGDDLAPITMVLPTSETNAPPGPNKCPLHRALQDILERVRELREVIDL